MFRNSRAPLQVLLLASVGLAAGARPAAAEEPARAVLRDGRPVAGHLARRADGTFAFRSGKYLFPLNDVASVRFPPRDPVVPPGLALHCVTLEGGETVRGELRGLDAERLRLRPAWGPELSLPRAAVARLDCAGDLVPVVLDDFERDRTLWKRNDPPPRREEGTAASGRFGLAFGAAGQVAEHRLAAPLAAGRVQVSFHVPAVAAGRRCWCELEFAGRGGGEPGVVRVEVAGPGRSYAVEAPRRDPSGPPDRGAADYRGVLPRSQGWHRLAVEFGPSELVAEIDGYVLLSREGAGPGAPLRSVRLASGPATGGEDPGGKVHFDDFVLARREEPLPLGIPFSNRAQDEVVLEPGDQLFGRLAAVSPEGLTLAARFGRRDLAWGEVRSVTFARGPVPLRPTEGQHVRLRLRAGGGETDELEGVMLRLDADELALSHALFGELALPAEHAEELRPLFHGRREWLDTEAHHLGRELEPRFVRPRPEGLSLRRTFRLAEVPRRAWLVARVAHLPGPEDGAAVAAALKAGALRTEVRLNGRAVDYLNRFVDRMSETPAEVRVPLPADQLRAGENVLELRQTADPAAGRVAECEVLGLRLESED